MRKILALIFSFFITVSVSNSVCAQEKAKTTLTSVKRKGETVKFALESSKPFIFGNNRYVLYIGHSEFFTHDQSKKNGKGYMTFTIPGQAVNTLHDGDNIYLTYGRISVDDDDLQALSNGRRCWSLGTFSKSMIK